LELPKIIEDGVGRGASDIHISPRKPIAFRIDGKLCREENGYQVTEGDTDDLVADILEGKGKRTFKKRHSYDTSIAFKSKDGAPSTRARIHFYETIEGVCLSCRLIPLIPKTLEQLGVPNLIKSWIRPGGIILISGLANMGKTTTLAAIIAHLNDTVDEKIVILEDPIEYIHEDNLAHIDAREVGTHCPDYTAGLKDVHREDTTAVLVGEIRDRPTMDAVFGLAENGLKVFASIHAVSAVHTIKKIVSWYVSEPESAYQRLCWNLSGIMNNSLVPKRSGGRILACDIITANDKVKQLLDEGKIMLIKAAQEDSRDDDLVSKKRSMEALEQRRII